MLTDSIVALASGPGRSALAVIRLSGEGAFQVAATVIRGFAVEPTRSARLAEFVGPDGLPVDQGLYLTFAGPRSYTGQDLVELTCHGGLLVPGQLLAALQAAGARQALPGEFTRRAVFNGKLDLLQAEAVGDLVDATATAQARSALRQLEGGLSRRLGSLRDRFLDLLAMLGYEVDFPEEDDGPIARDQLLVQLGRTITEVEHLLATAPAGERLREGALVVLAGRPNAGKSSLFNVLLGTDRALVTEIPGTTRDTVEAYSEIAGWPVRLADTAGLWDAPTRLDQLGIAVSRRYLSAADLVLLCVESGEELLAEDRAIQRDCPTLLIRTKADLGSEPGAGVPVSIVTGQGIQELRQAMVERLFAEGSSYGDMEPLLTRERHRVGLARALEHLREAAPHLAPEGDPVLAAHHVLAAVRSVDELVGAVGVEDVLDQIFSRFCVGK